jgi:hypothetical protein
MSTHFIEKANESLDPTRFAPLRLTAMMPTFGARIEGIDLLGDLTEEIRTLLRRAWLTLDATPP